ncbi:hypothetical protein RSOLAG22IIIB_02873 [Rhizoctonia solani]|uniref:Uncharacterized protein n=1 Tax=Rhizoctonia solani TaxID=456999 RepID=A0A0K6FL32_9AGAM|nr:hypothetical protein RSOLAG22IIIB_02873 [Rhizoctonia solani]
MNVAGDTPPHRTNIDPSRGISPLGDAPPSKPGDLEPDASAESQEWPAPSRRHKETTEIRENAFLIAQSVVPNLMVCVKYD